MTFLNVICQLIDLTIYRKPVRRLCTECIDVNQSCDHIPWLAVRINLTNIYYCNVI